ncbi:exodeoxyribonuclease V subunit beta [Methyloterricola oryzae]|uniref:exodeoxyribonuclease V subunit beta n=1 Tax=Methyloterricola oryzae TaxID=1495050 RepID=UPI0005EBA5C3|nr:exodeoxyribonuclease V subunit beta [Methyloterricola oryzae]
MSTPAELDVFHCPLDGIQLIEASAGTGKTWNICGLYLRLLLEQKRSVREILVVTFTNAATAELRERIRARLLDLSLALEAGVGADPFIEGFTAAVFASGRVNPDEAADRLRLALLSFDEASIFTIHGFCQRALADTPFAAGLPFRFELMPDDNDLKRELASDFWRTQVVHGSLSREFTAYLLDQGSGPDWLVKHLKQRLQKPLARLVWPDFSAMGDLQPPLDRMNALFLAAQALWQRESEAILELLQAALPQLNGQTYKPASISASASNWQGYFDGQNPLGALGEKQLLLSAERLAEKTKKNCVTPQHPFFDLAAELLALHGQISTGLQLRRLQLLHDWLAFAPAELAARKQTRRVVSFDDLLGKLFQALDGGDYPWLTGALRQRFPCALIDEFQDTDPLQFGIFRHIYASGEKSASLFLVGDPKQAIYSFRSADLHTYLAARGEAARLHTLSANQRSCAGLIDACNGLFQANRQAFVLAGLYYHAVRLGEKPRAAFTDASAARGALELWALPEVDGVGPVKPLLQEQVPAACAAEVARLINAAEAGLIRIGERPLRASDIALLVRSHAQGARLRLALAERGVASVELSQQSIFATEQAEELERILQAVIDPTRIGPIKAALATEIMGEDGNRLFALNMDEARLAAWLERFQDYRRTWQEQGFALFWQTLLRDCGTAQRLLGGPGGERKLTNLVHLGELLVAATHPRTGPEALLRWLAERRRDGSNEEVAQLRLESDENLVQILTIHKSKGLEFPIVFCPYLWDGGRRPSGKEECLAYHLEGKSVLDFSVADEARCLAQQGLDLEDAAEQVRLIYVALTRAIHRCYLIAGNYLTVQGSGTSSKESSRGLLNWLAAGDGIDFRAWRQGGGEPTAITAAWERLAAATPGVRLSVLPGQSAEQFQSAQLPAEAFRAREIARLPREGWRLGSFSGLVRSGASEHPVADRDGSAVEEERLSPEPTARLEGNDILRFPRGEQAGHCLHRALELADFTEPRSWPGAIQQALAEYPQGESGMSRAELVAMMENLFSDLLGTPLRDGIRLDGIGRSQRLTELEFCLPLGHLAPKPLAHWLQHHGYGYGALGFSAFSGYLKGFIDLVFQHGGRYFIVDWKSNHLGDGLEDYGPAGVQLAMDQHGYHLQYLCYTLALHRYLRFRLPDYDYDAHVGGCLYLFLRGVRPGWHNPDGTPSGVYFHRPERAVLDSLEQLFSQPAAGPTA